MPPLSGISSSLPPPGHRLLRPVCPRSGAEAAVLRCRPPLVRPHPAAEGRRLLPERERGKRRGGGGRGPGGKRQRVRDEGNVINSDAQLA